MRSFVGEYRIPHSVLDVARPTTQGPFAMPDYYFELRRQQAAAIERAGERARPSSPTSSSCSPAGATARSSSTASRTPRRAIVALGSSAGTVKDVVDELRDAGEPVGLLRIGSFRPFPAAAVATRCATSTDVAVLDRADSPGGAPPLLAEVAAALYGSGCELTRRGLRARRPRPAPGGHPRRLRTARRLAHVGLRGAACPV